VGERWNKSLMGYESRNCSQHEARRLQGRAEPWRKGKRNKQNNLFEKKNTTTKTDFYMLIKNKN